MKKILIVEDDPIVANVYRNKLSVEGYNVDIAEDGEVGYDKVRSFRPDLIILDLILPKVSGVELMRKLRADPAYEKLPIVVFSNTYLSNVVKEAWKAGATKCLSKANCTPKQVIEVIRSVLTAGHASPSPAVEAAPAAPAAPPADGEEKIPFPAGGKLPAPETTPAKPDPAADPVPAFLKASQATVLALRGGIQNLIKQPAAEERIKQLEDMQAKVHALSGGAAVSGLTMLGQLSEAYEALLREMRDKPNSLNPSTLRTAAAALDFLDVLVRKGRLAEMNKGPVPRILVVDDELLSRRAITHALDRAKLPCQEVEDSLAALKLLDENHYDLVFLDADMPGMNGFELCAKLRTMVHHRKTPVVFVTALTDFDARANSTMAGGNDFIGKPFPFIELAVKALIYILRNRVEAKK